MLKSAFGAAPGAGPAAPLRRGAVAAAIALLCLHAGAQTPPAPAATPAAAATASAPATATATASTQPAFTLKDAVQQAVLNNPEVLSRWHTIKAAEGERDAARGGLLPRVDLTAAIGPERRSGITGDTNRNQASLSVSQLLYDGFATRSEFQRLDHTARVRLFEFFETSENVALEAARAWYDVLRYRELVRLAEDNYVDHRAVYSQTERRVNARVARAVDLEQVSGRLALAEANLLTEVANLHDTTARFQRLMGRLPSAEMPLPPPVARDMPASAAEAMSRAQLRNPTLLAAIENVRASQAALATRSGSYVPRLDARVRRDQGRNNAGVLGTNNATAAELVLSWNLFSGFADRARERQFAEQLNVAKDVRDKTCRDIRQTLVIAFNDVRKLTEQLEFLVQHEQAVSKALVAYRLQFDIGQRSLLDLLDTENELFQARRAVVNANQDLNVAYVRTQAAQGTLLRALELAHLNTGMEADLAQWSSGADFAQNCPVEPVVVPGVDKDQLIQRAAQASQRLSMLNARERAIAEVAVGVTPGSSLPGAATPTTPGTATPTTSTTPATPAARPAAAEVRAAEQQVKDALEAWRAAWAARDVEGYLRSYALDFTPPTGMGREQWEKRRRSVIGRASDVAIEVSSLITTMDGPDKATTTFTQQYRSASFRDSVTKTLEWRRIDGRWLIVREAVNEPAK